MALPSSGNPLSIAQIQGEFGGTNPASLSEYYSAHSSVPSTGNPISISDFYGLSDVVTFTYALIGGGGGGGHGFDGGANGVTADSGGTSSISGSGFSTVTAAGGTGGRSGYFHPGTDTTQKDGDASVYGAGGNRGANIDGAAGAGSDAPSTSYGAGGGGGGGDMPNNKLDSTGFAGEGGGASTRVTGTITVASGTTITVTIGGGGAGRFHGTYSGGDGAAGYATITANGVTTPFTSSGTIILTG